MYHGPEVEEYKVIIIDPFPEDAEKQLAEELKNHWKPFLVYSEDRLILKKTTQTWIRPRGIYEFDACTRCGGPKDSPALEGFFFKKLCKSKFHLTNS